MPAKQPEEVKTFFAPLVEQGKLKVILANERPDAYSRIEPTDDVRLIVDVAGVDPPEGVTFTKVLDEFRPDPIPEDQFNNWLQESIPTPPAETTASNDVEQESQVSAEPPAESASDEVAVPADIQNVNSMEPVDDPTPAITTESTSITDRPWTSFKDRGFKG